MKAKPSAASKAQDKTEEEQLAIVDETGRISGKSVPRKEAHEKGILHGASHVFLYRTGATGAPEILLQRRSPQKDSFPGCLDISSAGHVEAGMNFESTAQKELREELGLQVQQEALTYAFSQIIETRNYFHGAVFHNREFNKVYLLERDVEIAALQLQKEEVSEVLWIDADEIAQRLESNDSEICLDKDEFLKAFESIHQSSKKERGSGIIGR